VCQETVSGPSVFWLRGRTTLATVEGREGWGDECRVHYTLSDLESIQRLIRVDRADSRLSFCARAKNFPCLAMFRRI
jgi:hypothetical protein